MATFESKSFDSPDETKEYDKIKIDIVTVCGVTVARATLEPGWRWTESVKQAAGTDTCQISHLGYMASGRLVVEMENGPRKELKAGDLAAIPAGHDGWVVGNEPAVLIEFPGVEEFCTSEA
jgi:hypothetical protein